MEKSANYRTNGTPPLPGGVAAKANESLKSDNFWDDEEFQDQLTHLLIHDRAALERCAELGLGPDDFKPIRGMRNGRTRWITAERALEHFEKYHEPLDQLARADALDYAEQLNLGAGQISDLKAYVDCLDKLKPAAPASILDKVVPYLSQRLKAAAIQELVELQTAGQLTDEKWNEITTRPLASTSNEPDQTPTAAQWPEPLGPEAYYGLAGDLVKAIAPHTEADPAALLVQMLAAFGNVAGTGPHWMHSATRHALNLFVGIVGPTGTGKGSGLDQVMEIFREVDSDWSSNPNIYGGLASGEGFIFMVRDPVARRNKDGKLVVVDPGVEDKRLLLIQPEFAQVLEVCERAGNTLATKLRNAWDGKPLLNNSLSSHLIATNAHVSLIVHSTEEDLRDLMRRTMILNGFGNRFLWVCSRRDKSLPFGGTVPAKEREALVERLRGAVDFARSLKQRSHRGRMYFEKPAASNLWVSAYKTTLTRDGENPVTGRAVPQVRRMAHVYALMDCSEQARRAPQGRTGDVAVLRGERTVHLRRRPPNRPRGREGARRAAPEREKGPDAKTDEYRSVPAEQARRGDHAHSRKPPEAGAGADAEGGGGRHGRTAHGALVRRVKKRWLVSTVPGISRNYGPCRAIHVGLVS